MNTVTKKLLFVSMANYAGGAEKILGMMANETNSELIFIKRLFKGCLPLSANQEVKYLTTKPMLIGFVVLIKALYKYRSGVTIISTHPYLNAYLGFLKRIGYLKSDLIARECTSVFTRYSGLKRLSYKIAYKLGYPAINLVICQTNVMRDQFLANNKFVAEDKVIVRENPIDLNKIAEKANEVLVTEDFDGDFICSAGRLIPEKGFQILINAFGNLSQEHKNLKLLLLGEGVERANLEQLIKKLGLEDRVLLKGHITNPIPYYGKAKICVVSSIKEGFPNVLLEMMAVNNFVISTLCAGGIEDIPSITKVEVNNVDALTQAMRAAIEHQQVDKTADNNIGYLKNRSPKIYMDSILKEAEKVKYHQTQLIHH